MIEPRSRPGIGALPPRRHFWVLVLADTTWLTGAAWLVFHYFVRVADRFGYQNEHPMQHWVLVVHAAASLGAVWLFGVLWPGHVVPNWRARLSRLTGGALFAFASWLALSGLALYYIGGDALRAWTSGAHWVSGLVSIVPFVVHRRQGLRRSAI